MKDGRIIASHPAMRGGPTFLANVKAKRFYDAVDVTLSWACYRGLPGRGTRRIFDGQNVYKKKDDRATVRFRSL